MANVCDIYKAEMWYEFNITIIAAFVYKPIGSP
jgi:hypothetical protein